MDTNNKIKYAPQIIATLAACIGSFSFGNVIGWTSPIMPHLVNCSTNPMDQNLTACDLPVDLGRKAGDLIGSLFPVGALVAGQVTGGMMRFLGRRLTMISMSVPCVVGWILIVITKPIQVETATLFYIGRFLTGFGSGAFTLTVPLYVTEIADSSIRGALANCMQLSVTMGVAFVSGLAIEDAVNWTTVSGICIAFPVLMSVAMMFMPESPYFLVTKSKIDAAKDSLRWLRGSNYDVDKGIKDLQATYQFQLSAGSISLKQLLTKGVYLKPFIIGMMIMFFRQFCGIIAVLFSLQTIFNRAGDTLPKGVSAFLVTLAQAIATGVSVIVVDRYGRRILLILSDALMTVGLLGLGIFFYMDKHKCVKNGTPNEGHVQICTDGDGLFPIETVDSLKWLPLTSLVVYICFFAIGYGPLSWTINAEIYPREAKGLASAIAHTFSWFGAFVTTFFQESFIDGLDIYGLYFMYAVICAIGVFFVYFFLPETKGKSPEDMKAYFMGRKSNFREAPSTATNNGIENIAFES